MKSATNLIEKVAVKSERPMFVGIIPVVDGLVEKVNNKNAKMNLFALCNLNCKNIYIDSRLAASEANTDVFNGMLMPEPSTIENLSNKVMNSLNALRSGASDVGEDDAMSDLIWSVVNGLEGILVHEENTSFLEFKEDQLIALANSMAIGVSLGVKIGTNKDDTDERCPLLMYYLVDKHYVDEMDSIVGKYGLMILSHCIKLAVMHSKITANSMEEFAKKVSEIDSYQLSCVQIASNILSDINDDLNVAQAISMYLSSAVESAKLGIDIDELMSDDDEGDDEEIPDGTILN